METLTACDVVSESTRGYLVDRLFWRSLEAVALTHRGPAQSNSHHCVLYHTGSVGTGEGEHWLVCVYGPRSYKSELIGEFSNVKK